MFALPPLPSSWRLHLSVEYSKPYMQNLEIFLQQETATFYPKNIFHSLEMTPLESIKIVLLGQDPYFNERQAMGLSFSVPKTEKIPPSLKNIYREITQDLEIDMPSHGDLSNWARQGVLLLNTVLTVRENSPGSHVGKGWEKFTDKIIEIVDTQRENIVFLLWGKSAASKKILLTEKKHLVLSSPHPSPLSAHAGFFGNKHFSKSQAYLSKNGIEPIAWNAL